jgi:hypothetical protein
MYGSEFVAARLATEQIMQLKYTLRSLGVPIDGTVWMFGDNHSVITSSTIPHSSLNKRQDALSYHRVRDAIASQGDVFPPCTRSIAPSQCFDKDIAMD